MASNHEDAKGSVESNRINNTFDSPTAETRQVQNEVSVESNKRDEIAELKAEIERLKQENQRLQQHNEKLLKYTSKHLVAIRKVEKELQDVLGDAKKSSASSKRSRVPISTIMALIYITGILLAGIFFLITYLNR